MKKTVLMLAAIMTMAICLPSCSDDDKDDSTNNSNNTNPTETEVETVSLKDLRLLCGKTKTVVQDSLISKGYAFFKDTIVQTEGIYTYMKVNSNHDTTLFALVCYNNYVIEPMYFTSNNDNNKLLTAFKTFSEEISSWANQYSSVTYSGIINDSTYTTHSLFIDKLNTMDVTLINQLSERYNQSQTNTAANLYLDRNFMNIFSIFRTGKNMRKADSNTPKMIGLSTSDASSLTGKVQANKVKSIIRDINISLKDL